MGRYAGRSSFNDDGAGFDRRRLHVFVSEAASRHGAVVVGLLREHADDPFVHWPALNAADGLHPSDAGYRVWLGELLAQAALPQRLSSALAPER